MTAPISKSSDGQRFWLSRYQPVIEFDHRGARIGFLAPALAQFDQRIGLGRTRRDHAARPVIFERAAHQMDAIGDQRRSQRIAGMAGEALAVEGEVRAASRGRSGRPCRDGSRSSGLPSCLRCAQSRAVIDAEDLMRLRYRARRPARSGSRRNDASIHAIRPFGLSRR